MLFIAKQYYIENIHKITWIKEETMDNFQITSSMSGLE